MRDIKPLERICLNRDVPKYENVPDGVDAAVLILITGYVIFL